MIIMLNLKFFYQNFEYNNNIKVYYFTFILNNFYENYSLKQLFYNMLININGQVNNKCIAGVKYNCYDVINLNFVKF